MSRSTCTDPFESCRHLIFAPNASKEWTRRSFVARSGSCPVDLAAAEMDGLRCDSVGISFPMGWHFDSAVAERVESCLLRSSGDVTPRLYELDFKSKPSVQERSQLTADHRDSPLVAALMRDGVVRIDDWGLSVSALVEQCHRVFSTARITSDQRPAATASIAVSFRQLPAAEPLRRRLGAIAASYLGANVVLSSVRLLRLTNSLTSENQYISGWWHHDAIGTRLKAFVFLHEVNDSSRPTTVASGSHRTLYYANRGPNQTAALTRFTAATVLERHGSRALVNMTGGAGGGFIFDTNTLHRGVVKGSYPRDVLMIEHEARAKVSLLSDIASADRRLRDGARDTREQVRPQEGGGERSAGFRGRIMPLRRSGLASRQLSAQQRTWAGGLSAGLAGFSRSARAGIGSEFVRPLPSLDELLRTAKPA
jgi:hypothetical protein